MQLKHWTLGGLFLAGSLWGAVSFSFGALMSGGTEKDKADWSRVQAASPETKTEVQLSVDKVSLDQETHGRFHSATENSLTLRFEEGELYTFQKPDIEKVLTYRPVSERWAGWATLAVSSMIVAILLRGDTEGAPLVLLPFVAAPTEGGDSSFLGPLLLVGGIAAGIGAALGVAADAANRSEGVLLYDAPAPGPTEEGTHQKQIPGQ